MQLPRIPPNSWLTSAVAVGVYAVLFCAPAYGLDRGRTIEQLYHTAWTAKDGAPTQGGALAQTRDGFLWLGSGSGLYRFDGVRFDRYDARSGQPLPSSNVFSLLASPDGGLWIGYRYGGVSLLKDGRVSNFGESDGLPPGRVRSLAIDDDGAVWAATAGGLARLDGTRWRRVGAESGYPGDSAQTVFVDRKGTLWVATESTVVFLQKGTSAFQPTGERVEQVLRMAEAPDGSVWIAETTLAVRQVRLPGVDRRSLGPEVRVGSVGFLFDREGALWVTTIGDGLRRLSVPDRFRGQAIAEFGDEAEAFTAKDGLTADYATAIMEDREGDVWVATANGLDRFRESALVPVRFPAGYQDFGLAAGEDGEIWTGSSNRPVTRLRGAAPTFVPGFRTGGITCVSRDPDGVIWMGGTGTVYRFRGDEKSRLDLPAEFKVFGISTIFKDRAGVLWMSLDPEGLFRFAGGVWRRYDRQAELPRSSPIVGFVDPSDRKWFGYAGNVVAAIDGDVVKTYSRDDGLEVGNVEAIEGRSQRLWVGGTLGLAVLDGERFRTLTSEGDDAFVGISGIVETAAGDLWLNASKGVVHVSAGDVRLALEGGMRNVRYRLFDQLDGLPGTAPQHKPYPTAAEGSDGRIWFATSGGAAWIDPARLATNPVSPPVTIRSLVTESTSYETSAPVVLPAGTTSLRIDYTALCLSYPERVRFRYELEGVDDDWQDSDTRRQAFYNSLGPGTYTFRVVACNEDGVWNEEGATLVFRIVPTVYQTLWFFLLCVAAGLVAVWSLYRLRVRQIARGLGAKFDERLAERTRIARDLHDTLLQTIQASKLVAEDALERPDDDARLRRAMEKVSVWLGQAVDEGRAALHSLRASTTERNDLAEALRRAAEACAAEGSVPVTFAAFGDSREMHPIVRDEIYRVGYEAIRNACTHSKASAVAVELTYAHDVRVRVKDDGVGVDATVLAGGRAGHFGLTGMRERAVRIGASLTISSTPGAGTEVALSVPGDIAFREPSRPGRDE